MQQMIFIADLIACSTCFGHHYAHQQELESIIQKVAARGVWCFGFQVVGMVWSSAISTLILLELLHKYILLQLHTCFSTVTVLHIVGIELVFKMF